MACITRRDAVGSLLQVEQTYEGPVAVIATNQVDPCDYTRNTYAHVLVRTDEGSRQETTHREKCISASASGDGFSVKVETGNQLGVLGIA